MKCCTYSIQVSSRPVTLTAVDRSVAAAASAAAATASTADGGSMDDDADIANRLQSGGSGAKPKKARFARKHLVITIAYYVPRTEQHCDILKL